MSNTLRQTPDGKVYLKDRQSVEYLLNPSVLSKTSTNTGSSAEESVSSKFKLVTVRNLSTKTSEEREQLLTESRQRLAEAALSLNQPPPFPEELPGNLEDLNVFGVYVDEDIYPGDPPVYTFTTTFSVVKAFITANGPNKEDWSVHLAYMTQRRVDANSITRYTWFIVTIDSNLNGNSNIYFLSNEDLPESFTTVNLDYINYLGGGSWSALAVDPNDRITIYGQAGDPARFKQIGQRYRYVGNSSAYSIVDYSFTPTNSFTWNRGLLKVSYREREASQSINLASLEDQGIIQSEKTYQYRLDCYMSVLEDRERVRQEFAVSTALYVGNTNGPEIGSNTITPDYGTDLRRLSVERYNQTSNIIRPTEATNTLNNYPSKLSFQSANNMGILASDNTGSSMLYIDTKIQSGDIEHGYETKTEVGERGFQFGENYKLWWCPGKILSFRLLNKGTIYRVSKTTGAQVDTGETLLDRGELRISEEFANATETTWNALPNPQTGFFGITVGSLKWLMYYLNPPILGHEGVYYYQRNPNFSAGDARGNFRDDSFASNMKNTLLNIFAQMQGGLGGTTTVNSYYLGYRQKAPTAWDSIVVRDPSPEQKAVRRVESDLFPNSFWIGDYIKSTLDTNNNLEVNTYDRQGVLVATETSGPDGQGAS
jgi:hypothetical protein